MGWVKQEASSLSKGWKQAIGSDNKQRAAEAAAAEAVKASEAEQISLAQTAKAAADAQSLLQQRAAAEEKAKQAVSEDTGSADVRLNDPETGRGAAKRKAAYGRNYSGSGVSI